MLIAAHILIDVSLQTERGATVTAGSFWQRPAKRPLNLNRQFYQLYVVGGPASDDVFAHDTEARPDADEVER